ncbi:hypothetical protein PLESTB_000513000 [Pleodorina starrii]|uniref:CRAL-TRIO domain-containing protein n=1 Tax=Pleodorina starrii TaxID=330485 RepID=A0A9W6BG09_9CHLO|nr:hypothetical protein PLESTM_000376000 [Pleodorina starrii]GLC51536.1 hypothetical protein PLESTB_000513000 [Pleodorina starrii]GLC72301.1 hypothetical protein PLESTF_001232900 [Pleodorina starrii]
MSWFSHTAHPVQTEVEAFWYLNLTPEQQLAHDKLLEHLKETRTLHQGHDDRFTLLRFLKARQWDVHRAAAMYQSMVKWRIEQRTDHVYETFTFPEREAVLRHYPHFYHKTDKYGRPVYVELLGQTDASKILEATTLERLMHYHVCDWENLQRKILPACSVLAGRPIITKSVILDLKGVTLKNFGSAAQKMLRNVVTIDQDYYCESLGQMFIVNTPTVFRMIWAMVNPLLEERTRRKIVILGSDFLPTVTQLVPLESLPACLGGKSQEPASLQDVGPWLDVQLPNPVKNPHKEKAAGADGQEGGDCDPEQQQAAVAVKATTAAVVSPPSSMRQSATAPGRLHLEEDE